MDDINFTRKLEIVIKDIKIDGLVGWIGDFGKSVSIDDSVGGTPVRDILEKGLALNSISDETDWSVSPFSIIRLEDVTLKVNYERKLPTDLNDDDIQVYIGSDGEPIFLIDTQLLGLSRNLLNFVTKIIS